MFSRYNPVKIAQEVYEKGEIINKIDYSKKENRGKVILESGNEMPVYKGKPLTGIVADKVEWIPKDDCVFCDVFNAYSNGDKETYVVEGKKAVKVEEPIDKKMVKEHYLPSKLMLILNSAAGAAIGLGLGGMLIGMGHPEIIPTNTAMAYSFGSLFAVSIPTTFLGTYRDNCGYKKIENILKGGN